MRGAFLILILYAIGCAPGRSEHPNRTAVRLAGASIVTPDQIDNRSPEVPVTPGWTPAQLKIECQDLNDCAPQVGILVAAKSSFSTKVSLTRCTASLVESDVILTNGHCVWDQATYFVLPNQGQTIIRRVQKVLHKSTAFVAGTTTELELRPDIAYLKLESPITEISSLRIVRDSAPSTITHLKTYVVNAIKIANQDVFRVVAETCTIRRHGTIFPYEFSEAPNVFFAFDCVVIGGNSGSPLIGDDGRSVYGVIAGFRTLIDKSLTHEQRRTALAANVRCVDYPQKAAPGCLEVTADQSYQRFNAGFHQKIREMEQRTPRDGRNFETLFTAQAYQLKRGSPYDFELLYYPKCRLNNSISSLTVPAEHIRLRYDQWGELQSTIIKSTISTASLKFAAHDVFKVQFTWAKPFAPLLQEENHPRKTLGATFDMRLPVCQK